MARIVFTLEDGTEIETELDTDVITIGRHEDSIVVLPSGSVSSHHAIIKRSGESFFVQDLGTTNGTRLNGVDIEEAKLSDGDQLAFGAIPAVVRFTEPVKVVLQALPVSPVAAAAPQKKAAASPMPPPGVRRPGPMKPTKRPQPQYKQTSGCAGFLFFVLFILGAFIAGLHLRHYSENPEHVLILDVIKKFREGTPEKRDESAAPKVPEGAAPATPAPDPASPAAPTPAPAPAAGGTMN